MLRIILDTNVLVSALIQRSFPFLIVDRVFADSSLVLCLSDELFAEYVDVLNRPRFARFAEFHARGQALLVAIEARATTFQPTVKLDVLSDKDENKLLELAETCQADFLVTGNTTDFTLAYWKNTRILTPRQYWELQVVI